MSNVLTFVILLFFLLGIPLLFFDGTFLFAIGFLALGIVLVIAKMMWRVSVAADNILQSLSDENKFTVTEKVKKSKAFPEDNNTQQEYSKNNSKSESEPIGIGAIVFIMMILIIFSTMGYWYVTYDPYDGVEQIPLSGIELPKLIQYVEAVKENLQTSYVKATKDNPAKIGERILTDKVDFIVLDVEYPAELKCKWFAFFCEDLSVKNGQIIIVTFAIENRNSHDVSFWSTQLGPVKKVKTILGNYPISEVYSQNDYEGIDNNYLRFRNTVAPDSKIIVKAVYFTERTHESYFFEIQHGTIMGFQWFRSYVDLGSDLNYNKALEDPYDHMFDDLGDVKI